MDNDVDQALVARYRDGDREAFAELVVRYQRPIYNAAYWILRSADDARDVAQDVFLRVAEHLDDFDGQHRFFSWIYRIVMNECLNTLRSRRPTQEIEASLEAPVQSTDPVEIAETRARVRAAILQLTDAQRDVIVMRHFAEMRYEEIAKALEVPEKTVKSRLFSARQRLCELLADEKV